MRILNQTCRLVSLIIVAACFAAVARADNAAVGQAESEVRAASKRYLEATRKGDVDALRKIWTRDGDYVDGQGRKFKAQDVIARPHGEGQSRAADAGQRSSESTVRLVRPDVAIEDGTSGPTISEDGGTVTGRFSAVWVRQDNQWRLEALRETVVAAPTPKDHLNAFDWLMGEWVAETENGVVLVSSHWADDEHYIVRDFAIRDGQSQIVTSTQRIGWDSASEKFKCWTFDSQGGSGEGTLRQDGNRWVVEINSTMPNGQKMKTNSTYIPIDDARFNWESAESKVGDVSIPPRRIEFKRAKN
jgi:uncharacterized protein (TIGR02246 family)